MYKQEKKTNLVVFNKEKSFILRIHACYSIPVYRCKMVLMSDKNNK